MPTLYVCSFAVAASSGAPGRVSITRFRPQWWDGPHYAPLVPNWRFRSVPRDRYEDLYAAQLAELDAKKVVQDLIRLANSESVTLLCHDHRRNAPVAQQWCHHLYAVSWLQHELDVAVRDWEGVERQHHQPGATD
jgi:hypothetical protein